MQRARRWLSAGALGIGLCLEIAAAFVIAWLPARWWPALAVALVSPSLLMDRFTRRRRRFGSARLRRLAELWVERMPALRAYRPGGWRPETTLQGREHIDAGLALGHGVILWVAPFRYHSLSAKRGLAMAGYRVAHLSNPSHGFGRQPWAVHLLNRLRTRQEDRYLSERVRIDGDGYAGARAGAGAVMRLNRILKENRPVSITLRSSGGRIAAVTLFGRTQRVAVGAMEVAAMSGASLLLVVPARQADGSFVVHIEPPLTIPPRRRGGSHAPALEELGRILERYQNRYPGQLPEFRMLRARSS